jgi:hypothetical protein
MKLSTVVLSALTLASAPIGNAFAQGSNYVAPYTRQDGTNVQPHYRTNPDNTNRNNWTTVPNVNPHTGQPGTRSPDYRSPSYGAPRASSSPYAAPRRH